MKLWLNVKGCLPIALVRIYSHFKPGLSLNCQEENKARINVNDLNMKSLKMKLEQIDEYKVSQWSS